MTTPQLVRILVASLAVFAFACAGALVVSGMEHHSDRLLFGGLAVSLVAVASGLAAILPATLSLRISASIASALAIGGAVLETTTHSELFTAVASLEFGAQLLKIAVPFALAAMGGAITERAGVVDLALEAKLLFGAFAGASIAYATGNAYAGVVAGVLAGMLVAALQLGLALKLSADQVIVGVALNLLALGGTRFLLQLIFHEGSNSPTFQGFEGDTIVVTPIFWLAVLAVIAVPFAMRRTRWGLRLRAAGDRPDSLVAVGVSPTTARFAAGLVGGALAGAGGAQLSLAAGSFYADMSAGRGYIALAMVILAGWRPAWAALACLGVAAAYAVENSLQAAGSAVPRELAPLLPYVLTLVAVIVVGGKGKAAPRGLGRN